MNIYIHMAIVVATVVLSACGQDEIAPAHKPTPADSVQIVQGNGGNITLSGKVSYSQNYETPNSDELRDLNYYSGFYQGLSHPLYRYELEEQYTKLPSVRLVGETTTLTCILRSTDDSKPITAFDIAWKNTSATTVELVEQALPVANGIDLTQGDWYMLVFVSSNGGASGQTFTFDKNTGQLTVEAPSNLVANKYADLQHLSYLQGSLNGSEKEYGAFPEQYASIPSLFVSDWTKLNVTQQGGATHCTLSKDLALKPTGSLLILDEHYVAQTFDDDMVAPQLKETDLLKDISIGIFGSLCNWGYPGCDNPTVGWLLQVSKGTHNEQTAINNPPQGFSTKDALAGRLWLKEPTEVSINLAKSVAVAGVYHFYDADFGPNKPQGAYVFTRPGQTLDDRKSELQSNVILTTTEVNRQGYHTYTFVNTQPFKSRHRAEDDNASAKFGYRRYLWVNATRNMYANEYVNRRPYGNGYTYDQIETYPISYTHNVNVSEESSFPKSPNYTSGDVFHIHPYVQVGNFHEGNSGDVESYYYPNDAGARIGWHVGVLNKSGSSPTTVRYDYLPRNGSAIFLQRIEAGVRFEDVSKGLIGTATGPDY